MAGFLDNRYLKILIVFTSHSLSLWESWLIAIYCSSERTPVGKNSMEVSPLIFLRTWFSWWNKSLKKQITALALKENANPNKNKQRDRECQKEQNYLRKTPPGDSDKKPTLELIRFLAWPEWGEGRMPTWRRGTGARVLSFPGHPLPGPGA